MAVPIKFMKWVTTLNQATNQLDANSIKPGLFQAPQNYSVGRETEHCAL